MDMRMALRGFAGIYLLAVGVRLIRAVVRDRPENMPVYVAIGAVFAAVGVALLVWFIREYRRKKD